MSRNIFLAVLYLNLCFYWPANGDDQKTSLVFVIDDTGSMGDDIDEVKTQVDGIFDAALNSSESTIEDFIIVTFNDPDVKHRTTTKDKDVFKKTLADIQVDGGDDCPEMALTGLELALSNSRNGSLVYLFTDADAKDFNKLNNTKKLALDKGVKINFVLTGTCAYYSYFENEKKSNNDPGHRAYFDLAEGTGGQVFSVFKKEVGKFLSHAKEYAAGGYSASVVAARAPAADFVASDSERLAGGLALDEALLASNTSTYNFDVNEDIKDLLISISGPAPKVEITGPGDEKPKIEEIATTSGSKVLKILDAKPGKYTALVTSSGRTTIVINAKTTSGASKSL